MRTTAGPRPLREDTTPGALRTRFLVVLLLVPASAWRLYASFEDFFDWQTVRTFGEWAQVQFLAGPMSFFPATVLGLVFTAMASRMRGVAGRRFWLTLAWLPPLWLAAGALVFIGADGLGPSMGLSAMERLLNYGTVVAPMLLGAVCLMQMVWALRERGVAAKAAGGTLWRRYAVLAGKVSGWVGVVAGSLMAVVASTFLLLMASCKPPALATLAERFPADRAQLETIVRMSDEDSNMAVIDPGWLRTWAGDNEFEDTPNTGITKERWQQYRRIFRRVGLTQGIRRARPHGDAFLIVKSVGLLDRGYSNGYLYCAPGSDHAYPACTGNEVSAQQPAAEGREAYSFLKASDHWFAYSEGPL